MLVWYTVQESSERLFFSRAWSLDARPINGCKSSGPVLDSSKNFKLCKSVIEHCSEKDGPYLLKDSAS